MEVQQGGGRARAYDGAFFFKGLVPSRVRTATRSAADGGILVGDLTIQDNGHCSLPKLSWIVRSPNRIPCRTTGCSPNAAWDKALEEKRTVIRPCPPSALLDLHLALHLRRRVNADFQIDFLGRSWPIAPTKRAAVTLIHHPLRRFWAVTQPPLPPQNNWPEILGDYSL